METDAPLIALTILQGVDKHYRRCLEITRGAQQRFENCEWQLDSEAARSRITLYNKRVGEAIDTLKSNFELKEFDEQCWKKVKIEYIHLLYQHKQPELAETFFNSIFTSLFHRRYYNNNHIFVRPGLSTEYLDDEQVTYISLYPTTNGLIKTVKQILLLNKLNLPYEDLTRDVHRIVCRIKREIMPNLQLRKHFQLRVLTSLFYRNKAAYIIGMGVNGDTIIPFVIPLLNNGNGEIFVDALIHQPTDITNLFSFARAYFMVDSCTPSAIVDFLLQLLPAKSKADIYTSTRNSTRYQRHGHDGL